MQLSSYGEADGLVRELTCICSCERGVLWKVMTFNASVSVFNSKVTGISSLTLVR